MKSSLTCSSRERGGNYQPAARVAARAEWAGTAKYCIMKSESVGRDCVMEINGIRLPDDIAAVVDTPIWRLNHPPHVLTNTFPGLGNLREGQLFPLKQMKFENAFEYDEEVKNEINFWRYCTTRDSVKEG
jgi:hypothetical protein